MAFNLTGVDPDLYYSINSSIQVGLFFLIALPALILILLCVVALLFAKNINWPIRIVLIDIYTGEICYWLGISVISLGFPVRARIGNEETIFCSVSSGLFITSSILKFSATALYAIIVYIFIKYGIQKVKLYAIILYICISWIASISISIIPYLDEFGLSNNNGLCELNSNGIASIGATVMALIFICIIIVFSLLTYCYVKKNTLQDNVEVKKAIIKNLIYLAVSVIVSLICDVAPTLIPYINDSLRDKQFIYIISVHYIFDAIIIVTYLSTPIAAIIILKPIRQALKGGIKKLCSCCKENQDSPMITDQIELS